MVNDINNDINVNVSEERRYCVYKHTSPSGKVYIGITGQNPPEKRWLNGRGYKNNPHFYKAINRYGWENFIHEVLIDKLTREEAMDKEVELIREYNSTNQDLGYNIEDGGKCCICATKKPVSQYTRDGKFIATYESIDSANLSIECGDVSACCNGRAKTAGGYIWRYVDEELTDEYLAWCNYNAQYDGCVEISQYSIDGNFIKIHNSIASAGRSVCGSTANIIECCKSQKRTAYGYIWRYANEELTQEHIAWCNESRNEWRKESVTQYSKNGEFINIYDGINVASIETGISSTSIASCCRKEYKTAGNFIWMYSYEEITPEHIKWCNSRDNGKSTRTKFVTQYNKDGEFIREYKSGSEAQEKIINLALISLLVVMAE